MIKNQATPAFCTAFVAVLCFLTVIRISVKRGTSVPVDAPHSQPSLARQPGVPGGIVGHWYMGTMMGKDCDLILHADGTMTVQTGGCFHKDEPIRVRWRITRDKITWSNAAILKPLSSLQLEKQFGSYLSIIQVGKNTVLVPQNNAPVVKRESYHYQRCFWKNLMGDKGLKLPEEAKYIDRRREKSLGFTTGND